MKYQLSAMTSSSLHTRAQVHISHGPSVVTPPSAAPHIRVIPETLSALSQMSVGGGIDGWLCLV